MSYINDTKATLLVEYMATEALDYLMTEDSDYLVTNQSRYYKDDTAESSTYTNDTK